MSTAVVEQNVVDQENVAPQQLQARLKNIKKRRKSVAAVAAVKPLRAALPAEELGRQQGDAAEGPGTPKPAATQECAQRTPNTQREHQLRAKYEKACDARDKLKFQVRPFVSCVCTRLHVHSPPRLLPNSRAA